MVQQKTRILFNTRVDSESADTLVDHIEDSPFDRISLTIDSAGGCLESAWRIIDAIEESPATITARIHGVALSAAAMMALACDRVLMTAKSTLMLHEPRLSDGEALFDEIAIAQEELDTDEVYQYIFSRTPKRSRKQLRIAIEDEIPLTARQAKKLGLIDRILPATGKEEPYSSYQPDSIFDSYTKGSVEQRRIDYAVGAGQFASNAPTYVVRPDTNSIHDRLRTKSKREAIRNARQFGGVVFEKHEDFVQCWPVDLRDY